MLAVVALVRAGWAQKDVHAIENDLRDKPMTLRSYSADSVARYSWAGGKLEAAPVKLHALGVFIPQSVTLKKNELLTIGGTRSTLILDSKTGQPKQAGQSFMNIEVDLHGADPAIVLPKMQEMLFFPDLAQAIAALP